MNIRWVRFADRLRHLVNRCSVDRIDSYSTSLASLTAATAIFPVGDTDLLMKSTGLVVAIMSVAMTGCYGTETNSSGRGQATPTDNANNSDGRTTTEIMPGVSTVDEPGDFAVKMPLSGQTDKSRPTIEVVVRIAEGDQYYIGKQSVSKEQISARLKEAATMAEGRIAENCTVVLRIIDEGASSYECAMEVMRLATDVGITSISFGPTDGDE